jgi:hypothetical protein
MNPWVRRLSILGLVVFGLLAVYTWAMLSWSYSSGERAGWVQKFSHKGWICKTWEGELAMVSMPGTTVEKFLFTVREQSVVDEINRSMGKRVALHYDEKMGILSSCFGESRYFVSKVITVEEAPLQGVMPSVPAIPTEQVRQ